MKSGIVFDLNNKKATIMVNGGEFISVPRDAQWEIGDVVQIERKHFGIKQLAVLAALVGIMLFGSASGYKLYYSQVALISIDVNPSIEFSLNRFDKVIGIKGYNEEGAQIVSDLQLKNKSYNEAIKILLQSEEMKAYVKKDSQVEVAVYAKKNTKDLKASVDAEVSKLLKGQIDSEVHCYEVGNELVSEAHASEMTPGKYKAYLDLKEYEPELQAEECQDLSVKEIRQRISAHHQEESGKGGNNNDSSGHQNGENGNGNGSGDHSGKGQQKQQKKGRGH
ncbi:anti-sigma factor domain-containing protein [Ohessyouella blattaphilus]|uniref:Anti-sigma factor domain-containing protein n=1 Tax=Ohessyouella blattaphilus TaxID=2949333 RepID=A0ABT1ELG2_9FIRM|nr:anti-sigma factor domain-containing protein [Ohessyouella blattaphilus]MCP1111543.1 anti-sigma factor domain-containing protein [Ohessyouella blattaphilus]MCR8564937.1 anti-sigma factor domain-containing protein [Ohessyouella blattaphilus]MDL2251114.1 anti-sigma factor domain-containing protein [Lachnospiraceae bacterium OttesenSCG-928-J05]